MTVHRFALIFSIGFFGSTTALEAVAGTQRVLGDFDGDGKADVLLRHADTGSWRYYPMDGRSVRSGAGEVALTSNLTWALAGIGDLNGDGRDDVLMRRTDSGRWYYYPMNGRRVQSARGGVPLTRDLAWAMAGIGDFDGDGRDDVLMRHGRNGRWRYYPMNGRSVRAGAGFTSITPDLRWALAGIGDLNGDGRDDVLLRNSVTGEWHYYPMNGRRILDASGRVPGLNSNLASTVGGIGDFDGDGRADVLTRGGRWFLSPMNGRTVLGGGSGYVDGLAPDVSSALAGIGDMNGDGRDDVLVRRADGAWYYYPMNGLQVLASAGEVALPAAAAWRVPGLVVDDGGGGGGDSDRHGNTRSSATRVALPSTTTGRIDPGNDTDYFRFEVSARESVVLETAGGLDTIGTLFNARGSRLEQDNDGAGRPNFRIERTLGAGTYYVRVHSRGTAIGAYTLHLRRGGGGSLAISTSAASPVQPFEIFPLRVENGTAGADYDILIDLSGTGNFLDRNTIEVAPVTSADGDLMMAAPLPEALAEGNTARRFALLVRERGEGTLSNTLTFTLGRTDVPAALAGHPTVILDVVLKAVYEGLDDPLLAVEAGAIEPGRSVRVARALGLDTAYSDAQAEALLRSLFGVELVAPAGAGALSGRSQAASWQPSAQVRCQFWAPNALCNAMEQLTDCVGDAMNGRLSGSPFRHCARIVKEELAGGWTDYGEKINSFGSLLRGAAPRLARVLGLGSRPAQAVYDINAAVRQGIGMNKTLRTITERAEALHQSFESLRDGTRTLTEGLPDLVAEVEQQAGAVAWKATSGRRSSLSWRRLTTTTATRRPMTVRASRTSTPAKRTSRRWAPLPTVARQLAPRATRSSR